MTESPDFFLGEVAVRHRLITRQQLEECLAIQRSDPNRPPRPLGQILLERAILDPARLEQLLQLQKEAIDRRSRSSAALFGQIAVARGLISADQLHEAIRQQLDLEARGQRLPLGQILVKNRAITPQQFVEILKLQERALLQCPGCSTKYNVLRYREGQKIKCKRCGKVLVVPTTIESVTVAGTITPSGDTKLFRALGGTSENLTGTTVGPYRIVHELGRGGMGVVFKAIDSRLNRTVALKVLRPSDDRPDTIARFQREARTAAQLRHPNIVAVHDFGTHEGLHYFSMNLIDGEALDVLLAQKRIPLKQAIEILRTIAQALHAAHQQGVVHRDVKPSNIMIDRAGTPFIMDFGLARGLDPASRLTRTGAAVGTPYYMAPEQVLGQADKIDARTDVYALGVVLYEILTNRLPFIGGSTLEVYDKILTTDPIPPRALNARVGPELEAVCLKAMEHDPRRRYPSAEEVAQELHRWLSGQPVLARPPGPLRRMFRLARRHRWAVLGAAAALLLVVTGAAIQLYLEHAREQSRRESHRQRVQDAEGRIQQALDERRYDDAIAALHDLAKLEPQRRPETDVRIAEIQERRTEEQLQEALGRARQAIARHEYVTALDHLRTAASLRPDHPEVEELRRIALGVGRLLLVARPADVTLRIQPLDPDRRDSEPILTSPKPEGVPLVAGLHDVRVYHNRTPLARFPLAIRRDESGAGQDVRVELDLQELASGWRLVPAGPFRFGTDDPGVELGSQRAARTVDLPGFAIEERERFVAEYRRFLESIPNRVARGALTPEGWSAIAGGAEEHELLNGLSFWQARWFAAASGERLPLEAEWEKAARGVDGRRYVWGNNPVPALPGGTLAQMDRSPYDIPGLAGGVAEWTLNLEQTANVVPGIARGGYTGATENFFRADLVAPYDGLQHIGLRRARSVLAFQVRNDPEQLAGLLSDAHLGVRQAAVRALGALGASARPHLERALGDTEPEVVFEAARQLRALGVQDLEPLIQQLRGRGRLMACAVASFLGDQEALQLELAQPSPDVSPAERGILLSLAGSIHALVPLYEAIFGTGGRFAEWRPQLEAMIQRLEAADDPWPAHEVLLEHPRLNIRHNLILVIRDRGDQRAVPALRRIALQDPSSVVRTTARQALRGLGADQDEEAPPLPSDVPVVEGRLEPSDPTLTDGSYFDRHEVQARAGQILTVTMESEDFNCFLILEGPQEFQQHNDDYPGMGTNSRIDAVIRADGTYTILANSLQPGETGTYRLRIWVREP